MKQNTKIYKGPADTRYHESEPALISSERSVMPLVEKQER